MLEYKLSQVGHSKPVLHACIDHFGCGRVNIDNRKFDSFKFVISKKADLANIIIPHFENYPLCTSKHLDYLAFKEAVEIVNRGDHLFPEGLNRLQV